MIGSLFTIQRLIRSFSYDDALIQLGKLEESFSDYSTIYEMKGMVYYFKKMPEEALANYRLAFGKNTENADAYRMKIFLEKQLNVQAK